MSAAEIDGTPPRLVARVRAELEALVAASHSAHASVRHRFDLESSEQRGSVYGWETVVEPAGPGAAMRLWFDGHDDDLVLEVGAFGWFEWFDLDAEDAVAADFRDITEAVLAGRAWEYRTSLGRGCEVRTSDGRLLRAGDGRQVLRSSTAGRVLRRRQVAAYGGGSGPTAVPGDGLRR